LYDSLRQTVFGGPWRHHRRRGLGIAFHPNSFNLRRSP
jgi:hypothetical protein